MVHIPKSLIGDFSQMRAARANDRWICSFSAQHTISVNPEITCL
jgi:hypothetical protein